MAEEIVQDYETFFSTDGYRLGRQYLTTEEYVRHPRFEAHGCGIYVPHTGERYWWRPDDIRRNRDRLNQAIVIHHHAHFDGLINAHHFDIKPAAIIDTLSMARLIFGNHLSNSLSDVRERLGESAKETDKLYDQFINLHWEQMSQALRNAVATGAINECVAIYRALKELMRRGFPIKELRIIDATVRMFTEPTLLGNQARLETIKQGEEQRLQTLLDSLKHAGLADPKIFKQNTRFIQLLTEAGVDVAYKKSPAGVTDKNPSGMIPAFAKNDYFMQDLLEDPDDFIAALAHARVDAKSTITKTRVERYIDMSRRGPLCIYLSPFAAHTTRWGGGDKTNFQNLPRMNKPGGKIRLAIMAPPGYLLGKVDSSQIEARILDYVAGEWDWIAAWRAKRDIYSELASKVYGFPVNRNDHPDERGTGKQLKLSCGFGASAATIQRTARLGTYGPPVKIDLDTAIEWRDAYRSDHTGVVRLWEEAGKVVIPILASGGRYKWGPVVIDDHRMWLPNGCPLLYDTLMWHNDNETGEKYWRVRRRDGWTKLYGAKLVENLIQSLARVVLSEAMLRILSAGFRIPLTVHDDLFMLVRHDAQAESKLQWLIEQLRVVPAWLPDIPLDAEGHLSPYLELEKKPA